MIAKLIALFQNRPCSPKEELVIEALRRETRTEQNDKTADTDAEERVQDIMRAIAADPANTPAIKSPASSYLLPVFGSFAAMALVLLVFMSLSEQDKPASQIPEQSNLIETPKLEAYPSNSSAEPLRRHSFNRLREVALALPLATETTHLKRDVRRATDSLLAIVLPWGDLVNSTPTLTVPPLPPLPQTPYQTELDSLRRDTMKALDFFTDSISSFNG